MTVHFNSLRDIKEFVSLVTLQSFDIHVDDGNHCVNARSFMEMCTLDFKEPLHVQAGSAENEAAFALVAHRFIA